MAKRNFPSKEEIETIIENFNTENENAIIGYMMKQMGYTDIETLKDDEQHSKWGFDCGWWLLTPKDEEMRKEWNKYDGWESLICPVVFMVQSTTVQRPQIDYLRENLKFDGKTFDELFYARCHLD